MYFYLIVALQAYCLYHAFKNRKPIYWYFLIFFIPLLGSIIYLITQVFNQNDVDKIQEDITTALNPTKKIKELEAKIQHIDTYANRIDLADAYFKLGDFPKAILNYKKTLEDEVQDRTYATEQMMFSNFELKNYKEVIHQAETIKDTTEFKDSKAQFCYGMALKEDGDFKKAEIQLKQADKPFSNYKERLELAKLYLETDREAEAKPLLEELSYESNRLTIPNQKLYRETLQEIDRLLKTL